MAIYLLNLFSIPFYAFFLRCVFLTEEKQRKWLCWIVGIQLFLTAALRHVMVGGDLENYIPAFKYIGELPWKEIFAYPWEYGYVLLNKILYTFSTNERWLLVVAGFLIVLGYMRFIMQYSRECWLSLFIFIAFGYYCSSLSMLRQSIAIVCVLNSIQYVIDRDFRKFLGWVILGAFFHITALVFMLLYLFSRFRPTMAYFVVFLMASSLFSIFVGRFVLNSFVKHYFMVYEGKVVSEGGYSMLILLLLITFLGVWIQGKVGCDGKKINVFTHMMILACGLQFLSLYFSLFARVVLYFQVGMIVFIPELFSFLKGKMVRGVGKWSVICCLLYYFIVVYLSNNSSGIYPYKFLWE